MGKKYEIKTKKEGFEEIRYFLTYENINKEQEFLEQMKKKLGKTPSLEISYKVWNNLSKVIFLLKRKTKYKILFLICIFLGIIGIIFSFSPKLLNLCPVLYLVSVTIYFILNFYLSLRNFNVVRKYKNIKFLFNESGVVHIRYLIDSIDKKTERNSKLVGYFFMILPFVGVVVKVIKIFSDVRIIAIIFLLIMVLSVVLVTQYFFDKWSIRKLKNYLILLEYELLNGYEYHQIKATVKETIEEIFNEIFSYIKKK